MSWPATEDLRLLLRDDCGIEDCFHLREGLLDAALEQLESLAGHSLARASQPKTKAYDPPGMTASSYSRGGGTVLVLNDFLLEPLAVAVEGQPVTSYTLEAPNREGYGVLRFALPVYGRRGSVTVAGYWGIVQRPTGAMGEALLCLAAADWLCAQAERSRGISQVKDDEVSLTYGFEMLRQSGERMRDRASRLIRTFSSGSPAYF